MFPQMNYPYGNGMPLYYNPNMGAQERLNQMQQQYQMPASAQSVQQQTPVSPINARAVTGYEEAQAAVIPFDGSINLFTDFGHESIYLKQLNNDGTASLRTFKLVAQPKAEQDKVEYVLKSDFDELKRQFDELIGKINTTSTKQKGGNNNA